MKQLCPICDGIGSHFMIAKEGHLKIDREVVCKCWACKGSGIVEYDKPVNITDTTIRNMNNTNIK